MTRVHTPTDILRGSFCPAMVTISDGSDRISCRHRAAEMTTATGLQRIVHLSLNSIWQCMCIFVYVRLKLDYGDESCRHIVHTHSTN